MYFSVHILYTIFDLSMNNTKNQTQNINLLFYSRKCQTSVALIQLMNNEKLLQFFKLICVDQNLYRLPKELKVVPTLVIHEKDGPKFYEVQNAFKWVEGVKFLRQQHVNELGKRNSYMNMVKSQITQSESNGIHGFNNQEMTGISDTYAFPDIDTDQAHSYFRYGINDKDIILTPGNKEQTLKKFDTDKIAKEAELRRKEQENMIKEHQKQDQINQLISYEQTKLIGDNDKSFFQTNTVLKH